MTGSQERFRELRRYAAQVNGRCGETEGAGEQQVQAAITDYSFRVSDGRALARCTSLPLRSAIVARCGRGCMVARRPGSTGSAALLVRYFCGELALLAGTAVSGAVTWNTSSANFRWLASNCSANL